MVTPSMWTYLSGLDNYSEHIRKLIKKDMNPRNRNLDV